MRSNPALFNILVVLSQLKVFFLSEVFNFWSIKCFIFVVQWYMIFVICVRICIRAKFELLVKFLLCFFRSSVDIKIEIFVPYLTYFLILDIFVIFIALKL